MNNLSSCRLFFGLTDGELQDIEKKLVKRTFYKKEVIFRPNTVNKSLYILVKGIVKREAHFEGKNYTLNFLKAGDFFGEVGLFTGGKTDLSTSCLTDCEIYQMKQQDLEALLATSYMFTFNLLQFFAQEIKDNRSTVQFLAFKSVKQRIVEKLLYLSKIFKSVDEGNNTFIDLPISQKEFAYFVGSSREHVVKILNELKADKLIEISTKKITILDQERLERI